MSQGEVHFATFESVLIMAITAPPSVSVLTQLEDELRGLLRRHPEGASVMIVRDVPEGMISAKLDDETRAHARELVQRLGGHVRGLAYVFPRRGFGAALIRMVLNGMTRVVPFPARLFGAPEEAVAWLCELPAQPASLRPRRAELLAAVREARARLGVPAVP